MYLIDKELINNSKCGRRKGFIDIPGNCVRIRRYTRVGNKMATSRADFIHDLCRGSTLDAGGGPQRKNSGKFSILDGPPIKEREARIMGRVFSTIPPRERSAFAPLSIIHPQRLSSYIQNYSIIFFHLFQFSFYYNKCNREKN